VLLTMVFFHVTSVQAGVNIVAGMMGIHGFILPRAVAEHFPALGKTLSSAGVQFGGKGVTEVLSTICWIAVLLFIVLGLPNTLEIMRNHDPAIIETAPSKLGQVPSIVRYLDRALIWSPSPRWAAVAVMMTGCGILALSRVSAFLYWQF
jgi:alginate O-acetyltransferase complex protein AlgI